MTLKKKKLYNEIISLGLTDVTSERCKPKPGRFTFRTKNVHNEMVEYDPALNLNQAGSLFAIYPSGYIRRDCKSGGSRKIAYDCCSHYQMNKKIPIVNFGISRELIPTLREQFEFLLKFFKRNAKKYNLGTFMNQKYYYNGYKIS